jgi:hypothetical protein
VTKQVNLEEALGILQTMDEFHSPGVIVITKL